MILVSSEMNNQNNLVFLKTPHWSVTTIHLQEKMKKKTSKIKSQLWVSRKINDYYKEKINDKINAYKTVAAEKKRKRDQKRLANSWT